MKIPYERIDPHTLILDEWTDYSSLEKRALDYERSRVALLNSRMSGERSRKAHPPFLRNRLWLAMAALLYDVEYVGTWPVDMYMGPHFIARISVIGG